MEEILRKRYEAAQLLEFRSYAEFALSTRMAHSVEEVHAIPARARPVGARNRAA